MTLKELSQTRAYCHTFKQPCPQGLLVCRESCPYWSCVASKCVAPALGSDVDNNLSGEFHFGGGE